MHVCSILLAMSFLLQANPRGISNKSLWSIYRLWSSDAIWWHRSGSTVVQVMACCLKLLPEPILTNHHWGLVAFTWGKLDRKCSRNLTLICVRKLSTHWGRVTHICIGDLTIIGSNIDLAPGWRQAIIWTNAGILLIGPLGTKFSEILIEILAFSLKKNVFKNVICEWRPFCFSLNVLSEYYSCAFQGPIGQSYINQMSWNIYRL